MTSDTWFALVFLGIVALALVVSALLILWEDVQHQTPRIGTCLARQGLTARTRATGSWASA